MLCGGTSSYKVDETVKKITSQMKAEVEKQANESFATFEPIEAMTQVVGPVFVVQRRLLAPTTSSKWMWATKRRCS